MPHATQILPFAVGDGSNVETPGNWLADAARQTGFVAGIAPSAKFNTALRQANFTSAMIAAFTANYGSGDVNDDGDLAAYQSNFVAALGAALSSLIPAGLLYEGADTGTQNHINVTATTPARATFTTGSFIAVKKMGAGNSTAMTATVLNVSGAIIWPDGSPLASGQAPANAELLLYWDGTNFFLMTFAGPSILTALGGGEGIGIASNQIGLAFDPLTEADTLAVGDEFAFYQPSSGHHRKTNYGNILAKILAQIPTPGSPVIPANGPGTGVGQFITQMVGSFGGFGLEPPNAGGWAPGTSTSGASLQAGTVSTGGVPCYQIPMAYNGVPIYAGLGSVGTHDWDWPNVTLSGTWMLVGWELETGYTALFGYVFRVYWVRIA